MSERTSNERTNERRTKDDLRATNDQRTNKQSVPTTLQIIGESTDEKLQLYTLEQCRFQGESTLEKAFIVI